jgi:hypothetical protein
MLKASKELQNITTAYRQLYRRKEISIGPTIEASIAADTRCKRGERHAEKTHAVRFQRISCDRRGTR